MGFSRNVSYSFIVKLKIELTDSQFNMPSGLIGLLVLKVARGNN